MTERVYKTKVIIIICIEISLFNTITLAWKGMPYGELSNSSHHKKSDSSIQYLIVFVSNINICLRTNQLYISFSNHKYTLLIFKLKVFYLNNPVTLIYISYLFKTCLILILLKSCYQLSTKDPKH